MKWNGDRLSFSSYTIGGFSIPSKSIHDRTILYDHSFDDGQFCITRNDLDFYLNRNCQLGKVLQKYLGKVLCRYQNNNVGNRASSIPFTKWFRIYFFYIYYIIYLFFFYCSQNGLYSLYKKYVKSSPKLKSKSVDEGTRWDDEYIIQICPFTTSSISLFVSSSRWNYNSDILILLNSVHKESINDNAQESSKFRTSDQII